MFQTHQSEKELLVSDLELSMDYYSTIFGMKDQNLKIVDEHLGFSLCLKQAEDLTKIHPKKLMPEVYGVVDTVDDLYTLYLNFRENGALFAFNPRDTYDDGTRAKEFAIRDLDGYIIAFRTKSPLKDQILFDHPLVF